MTETRKWQMMHDNTCYHYCYYLADKFDFFVEKKKCIIPNLKKSFFDWIAFFF